MCIRDRNNGENRYRAIQLSVPTAIAHFRVVHRDADDNLIDSRDYNIDLNSGKLLCPKKFFSKISQKMCTFSLFFSWFYF